MWSIQSAQLDRRQCDCSYLSHTVSTWTRLQCRLYSSADTSASFSASTWPGTSAVYTQAFHFLQCLNLHLTPFLLFHFYVWVCVCVFHKAKFGPAGVSCSWNYITKSVLMKWCKIHKSLTFWSARLIHEWVSKCEHQYNYWLTRGKYQHGCGRCSWRDPVARWSLIWTVFSFVSADGSSPSSCFQLVFEVQAPTLQMTVPPSFSFYPLTENVTALSTLAWYHLTC